MSDQQAEPRGIKVITVLIPDGLENVMNFELGIEHKPPCERFSVEDQAQFIRGFLFAYFNNINPAYAERFREVNQTRA